MAIRPLRAAFVAALVPAALAAQARGQTAPALDTSARLTLAPVSLTLQPQKAAEEPGHTHDLFGHDDAHDYTVLPPPLGANLLEGWFDDWPHTHYSRRGTPFVHLFASEPAFMDRDFFLDYDFKKGEQGTVMEATAELEYTFTRRIGIVVEAPYAFLDPKDGDRENGIGDFKVSPRFLLLDYERFLLSGNLEFSFPTGDSEKGLGAGEGAINPSISTWLDLGKDFALHTNVGVEHGFRTDSDALTWGAALTYSIYLDGTPELIRSGGAVRAHFPSGLLNLIAEIRGGHPIDGDERGSGTAEWILGASYSITPHVEVRGALTFPAWNPREFDNGFIVSLIYHF